MKKRAVILSLILSLQMILSMVTVPVFAEDGGALNTPYTEPDTQVYNMNIDWLYKKPSDNAIVPLNGAMADVAKNGKQFYEVSYDDTDWETVSVPHQVNASDSFTSLGSNQGDGGQYRGIVFYRKHFTAPEGSAGKKFIIEFEGMDCACYLWVNGQPAGYYEAGINAFGFDISQYINATGDNVIALANDSTTARGNIMGNNNNYYKETKPGSAWNSSDGQGYEWNSHEFRTTQAGLAYNVNLHVKNQIYQTLPIYDNLKTAGTYIYADNFDIRGKKATIHVDAEVRNETKADANLTLQVDIVKTEENDEGEKEQVLKYSFESETEAVAAASDAGVVFETAVEKDAYSDSKSAVATELDGVSDPSLLEIINDAYKRPQFSTDVDPTDVDKNGHAKYFTYTETWSDWTAIDSSTPLTGKDSRGYNIKYGIFKKTASNGKVECDETEDTSKATHYMVLQKVEQIRHNESFATEVIEPEVSHITASFDASELDFWSTDAPHLYDVYTTIKDASGNVLDVQKITTGFRKVEYTIDDGLRINDKTVWLTGYAQRSANEWAAIGAANDWLTDYDMSLVKESGSNFIRWMHIAPRVNTVRATDKYGVAIVAPAGDKEGDASGRQWSQRVEVMRTTMIRFRNSPSVIFWEAGNNAINWVHQQEMTELKAKLDPYGGRFCGCRTLTSWAQIQAAEYVGTMLNRHASSAKASMEQSGLLAYNRGEIGYNLTDENQPYLNDKNQLVYPPLKSNIEVKQKYMPVVETEYHREESPRRVWDDFSPPDYDLDNYYNGGSAAAGSDNYDLNSEEFAINDAQCYEEFFRDRVNGLSGNNYYTAAAALCWTDSNQHARTLFSENGRMSGRVDAIRIPKQSFYAYKIMQQEDSAAEEITKEGVTVDNEKKHVHIIGHWNYEEVDDKSQSEGGNYYYPVKVYDADAKLWKKTGEWARRDPTKKTVYVVGSQFVSRMELFVDGENKGSAVKAQNTFIYAFPNIDVTQGNKVEAVAYDVMGNEIGRDEIKRAGNPVSVRLTPHKGAEGFLADGSDLMYFDVEVIDKDGNVCPLSYDRIDFELTGDAKFMGGYNSGYATNKSNGNRTTDDHKNWGANETVIGKSYVYAECGVNRVFVKAGTSPGTVTLKATITLDGKLTPTTETVTVDAYPDQNVFTTGLTKRRQQSLDFGSMPEVEESKTEPLKPLGKFVTVAKSEWASKLEDLFIYKVTKPVVVKDVYTLTLNGETITTTNDSYKPDSATGVVADVKPVLDALLKAGADFTYSEGTATINGNTVQAITVSSKKGQNGIDGVEHTFVIAQGQTALGYDGEVEGILTNAEIGYENGELTMEIVAILAYIDGVAVVTDASAKTLSITYNAN